MRFVMRLLKVFVSAFTSIKLFNKSSLRQHKHNVCSNSHKHKTMSGWIPTWHLHTMSASIARRSTTFPFPSSPHWAPNTTVTLFWGSRRIRSESTLSLERLSTGSPFRDAVSWPLDIVLSAAMPRVCVWRTAWKRLRYSNMVAHEIDLQNKSPVAKKQQKKRWSLHTRPWKLNRRNICMFIKKYWNEIRGSEICYLNETRLSLYSQVGDIGNFRRLSYLASQAYFGG